MPRALPCSPAAGSWWSVAEALGLGLSCVVLAVVCIGMPSTPTWPGAAQFQDGAFNPFVDKPRYRPPSCEAIAYPWASTSYAACPGDDDAAVAATAATAAAQPSPTPLACDTKLKEVFMESLAKAGRVEFLNFTGPVTGQAVSAMVVTPDAARVGPGPGSSLPVVYALHARDQSYEKRSEAGRHLIVPVEMLTAGIYGWVQSTICELDDVHMEPHILVFPLRGGDRMWMDCKDPTACALETQVTQELVPYVDAKYNTRKSAAGRACIGYSMGASGCINYAIKNPTLFGSVLVQSPGVWPRFVDWDQLVGTEGAATSSFSTRDFLLARVFDGQADYESKNTCNLLSALLHSGTELQAHRPRLRIWFGLHDPFIAQDEALFECFACNQMCLAMHMVKECLHSDFFHCVQDTADYAEYQRELYNLFKR